MIEQPHKKSRLCTVPFSLFSDALNKDIVIDAVFDNGEDVALDGGDSDSDGYLDEQSKNKAIDHPMQVVDETRTDTMKRKVLCGTVLTSCCALVDEEQSAQSINQFVKLAPVTKEKILKLKNNPKWDSVKPLIKSFFRSTIRLVKQAADLEITVCLRLPNLEVL
ncbi:hypothetical protein F2Q68_00026324 [Brassica cretica]|uniref:Uncharacterized protein n=1 Tax=Brassica cretica TaxID=69181 RepID=A0A8S9IC06_BRACR|nr:hypothetical protein F2Q68_00026324 [Brassica cretica]